MKMLVDTSSQLGFFSLRLFARVILLFLTAGGRRDDASADKNWCKLVIIFRPKSCRLMRLDPSILFNIIQSI